MNQYQARKFIAQRWMTLWPGLSSTTPYAFDDDACDESAAYARVRVNFGDSTQRTFGAPGNRKFTCPGTIQIELWFPPNAGKKRPDELVAAVKAIYDSVAFGSGDDLIQCFSSGQYGYSSKGMSGAAGSDGQFGYASIEIDFEHYEIR